MDEQHVSSESGLVRLDAGLKFHKTIDFDKRQLRRALVMAAQRGVAVTLLIGVGQFRMQDAVAQSFYPRLQRAGIRLVEYGKTQLHGKVAVVDDEWATVGSSNFDGLSLFVNHEANIIVRDKDFAQSLRAYIERGIADGRDEAPPSTIEDVAVLEAITPILRS